MAFILIIICIIYLQYYSSFKVYAMANRMDEALKNANAELDELSQNSSSANNTNTRSGFNNTMNEAVSGN